eukprot:1887846-Pleurochrysis_carterae.AAC.1
MAYPPFLDVTLSMHNALLNERLWHWETGEFATPMDNPGHKFGMKQVLGGVLEETRADNEEVAEAMESSLPESEGHRAKVFPLESPTPEEWAERAKEAGENCEI